MNKKKLNTRSKISSRDDIVIIAKEQKEDIWRGHFDQLILPSTVFFQVSTFPIEIQDVKKICWGFGDETKYTSITNKRQDPKCAVVKHIFKNKECETFTIQASVYTQTDIFLTTTFTVHSTHIKSDKNYIDPGQFKAQIIEFYETNDLSDELAESVQAIATRLAFAPNFINYTYREDMVGDALVKMIKALREFKYNPAKGNPFSYFTKIAYHAFCNRIKREKKARDAISMYQEDTYNTLINEGFISPRKGSEIHIDHDANDYSTY